MVKNTIWRWLVPFFLLVGLALSIPAGGYYFYHYILLPELSKDRAKIHRLKKKIAETKALLKTFQIAQSTQGFEGVAMQIIVEAFKSAVEIEVKSVASPYDNVGAWKGSGFLLNKEHRYIVTNRHVAGNPGTRAFYDVKFYNGMVSNAKIIYVDPVVDIAILQVDFLPNNIPEVKLAKKKSVPHELIFMAGNNAAEGLSFVTGYIKKPYNIFRTGGGFWFQESLPLGLISYSLNSQPGSSGSAVFNAKGEVIGVNCASNSVTALAIPVTYVSYILEGLLEGKEPVRNHIGAIFKSVALDKIKDFVHLPEKEVNRYHIRNSYAFGEVIVVDYLLKNQLPIDLEPGDIIWGFLDEKGKLVSIGNDLAGFDLFISGVRSKTVRLQIFRQGQSMEVDIPVQPIPVIQKMVSFGGTIFFESDLIWSDRMGIPLGTVTFATKERGRTVYYTGDLDELSGGIEMVDNRPIKSLKDLIELIPILMKKKKFSVHYKDFSKQKKMVYVEYLPTDRPPKVITFDPEQQEWEESVIE